MANSLNINLTGKTVVMEGSGPEEDRTVVCEGGFGCLSETRGSALLVRHVKTGQVMRMSGYEVEKVVE